MAELAVYFSSFQARSADILPLGIAIYERTDALNIWVPTTTSTAL